MSKAKNLVEEVAEDEKDEQISDGKYFVKEVPDEKEAEETLQLENVQEEGFEEINSLAIVLWYGRVG